MDELNSGGRALDAPDGMQVTAGLSPKGEHEVVFYTGRFATGYSRDEVSELIDVLKAWLEETK